MKIINPNFKKGELVYFNGNFCWDYDVGVEVDYKMAVIIKQFKKKGHKNLYEIYHNGRFQNIHFFWLVRTKQPKSYFNYRLIKNDQ